VKKRGLRRLLYVAFVMVVAGILTSAYGFSLLHSLEFGPAGYICPAYVCTFDDIFQAGYGWILIASYSGIVSFGAGVAALVGSLLVKTQD
jgi:hypothetical protein